MNVKYGLIGLGGWWGTWKSNIIVACVNTYDGLCHVSGDWLLSWHWDRLFFFVYFGFTLSVSFNWCCMLIH